MASIYTNWDHWMRDAGLLAKGRSMHIYGVPSGLNFAERRDQMNAALKAAYPDIPLEVYWHGGYNVFHSDKF